MVFSQAAQEGVQNKSDQRNRRKANSNADLNLLMAQQKIEQKEAVAGLVLREKQEITRKGGRQLKSRDEYAR